MRILILLIIMLLPAVNVQGDSGHGKAHDMGVEKMKMKMEMQQTDNDKHQMGHDMRQMDHDMSGMKEAGKYDYIRVETPAGFNAVIGTKNHLEELEPVIVTEKGQSIKVFDLTVKDVEFDIFPDKSIKGWGFNGNIPGPTIRVTEGDRVRIILKNDTDKDHTVHVHGQSKPLIADGIPFISQKGVKKGESHAIEFTVKNIGTSWYHCHVDSSHHVDMGMYGVFIVEPKQEKLEYDREYVFILDEWPTAHVHMHESAMDESKGMEGHDQHAAMTMHKMDEPEHKQMDEKPAQRDWYPETYEPQNNVYDGFTINGRSFPLTEPMIVKEGERVRIRFINSGYQQHFMHVHSHKFVVVARDGSYVDEPQKIDTVGIGPGQRVDIILLADNPGIWPFHCHKLNHVTNEHIYPGGMLMFMKYE